MSTTANFRRQYAHNAITLRVMLDKATAMAPRKYRSYTAAQLADRVALFDRLAVATDEELRTHLAATLATVRALHQQNLQRA